MNVQLFNPKPHEPLFPALINLAKDASRVDLAVAFVTSEGARAIRCVHDQLEPPRLIRLIVSVMFPTDLEAIAELAELVDVRIHLGPGEQAEDLYAQFHSKVVSIRRRGLSRAILVGSHNWTGNALHGGNCEASLLLQCNDDDPIVRQVDEHIEACWRESAPFDPALLAYYQLLQREYHPAKPRDVEKVPLPGFQEVDAVVILAEDHTGMKIGEKGDLYFRIPIAATSELDVDTPIWLFVFPKHSFLDKPHPAPKPVRLVGRVTAKDLKAKRQRKSGYLIQDIGHPCIERMGATDSLLPDQMWVAVEFERASRSEPLPLFHAGERSPRASLSLVDAFEYPATDAANFRAPIGLAGKSYADECAMPAVMVGKAAVAVPFPFAYPERAEFLVGEFAANRMRGWVGPPPSVRFKPTRGISEYVCAVAFESDRDLTNAIYSSEVEPMS